MVDSGLVTEPLIECSHQPACHEARDLAPIDARTASEYVLPVVALVGQQEDVADR